MARFLGIHKLTSDITDSKVAEAFEGYKQAAQDEGITAISAMYSLDKGFAYCQTEAENAEQVRKAHEKAQGALDDVIEIKTIA